MVEQKLKNDKFIVDFGLIEKNGVSFAEYLMLLLYKLKENESFNAYITKLNSNLLDKKLIVTDMFSNGENYISPKGRDFISSIVLSSQDVNLEKDLEQLANDLKELFPTGNKSPGHPWRGNTKEIVNKLKRFKLLYSYSNTEILNATKHYVENMENNQYMRVLKYFILKQNDAGEQISDLASYIENADEQIRTDWSINLRGAVHGNS